jgi:membrane protease YdiL (CAAX protease family)
MAASRNYAPAVPGRDDAPGGTPRRPLGSIGAVLLAYVGGTVVAVLLVSLSGAATNSTAYNLLSFVGLWCGFVGVPVYLSRTRGTGSMATDFGLRLDGARDVGLGVAAGLLAYGIVGVYSALIKAAGDHVNLGHEATQLSGHGLGAGFVVFAFAAGIGAPIAEEIYFRGLTQPVLQRYLGGVGGLVVTSVLFGFAHLGDNPIEVVLPLAAFGAIVGTLAWRTGRLGPGIIAHITFNGITVVAIALSR